MEIRPLPGRQNLKNGIREFIATPKTIYIGSNCLLMHKEE